MPRLVDDRRHFGHPFVQTVPGVVLVKQLCHLIAGLVHRRGDDMARRLLGELDHVFAEIGLDHLEAGALECVIDRYLFAHHGFSFGDAFGADTLAQTNDDLARLRGRACPMHLAAIRQHLRLETVEVVIEMGEGVLFDFARGCTQLLEFGKRVDGIATLVDKPAFGAGQRPLQVVVLQCCLGLLLKGVRSRFHDWFSPSPIAR